MAMLHYLPADVLRYLITENFSTVADVLSLMRVSKRIHVVIANSESLWKPYAKKYLTQGVVDLTRVVVRSHLRQAEIYQLGNYLVDGRDKTLRRLMAIGYERIAEHIYSKQPNMLWFIVRSLAMGNQQGLLEIYLRINPTYNYHNDLILEIIRGAVEGGRMELLQPYIGYSVVRTNEALEAAITHNQIDIVKWILSKKRSCLYADLNANSLLLRGTRDPKRLQIKEMLDHAMREYDT